MTSSESESETNSVSEYYFDSEFRIERASHIQSRLELLWVHSTVASYRSLSLNVIREVASYLWYSPKVLFINKRAEFCSFDPRSGEETEEETLESEAVLVAAATAGEDRFFVCATSDGKRFPTLLINKSDQIELPENVRRKACVYYDPPTDRVCVFGGYWYNEEGLFDEESPFSATCKQLVIGDSEWEDLPGMHRPRGSVPPCLHGGLVYLFGAPDYSVEAFDPRENTFALVGTLPEYPYSQGFYFTGSNGSEIVLVSGREVVTWAQTSTRTLATHTLDLAFMESTPAAFEGWVYWADSSAIDVTFMKISLTTGEVLMKDGGWATPPTYLHKRVSSAW